MSSVKVNEFCDRAPAPGQPDRLGRTVAAPEPGRWTWKERLNHVKRLRRQFVHRAGRLAYPVQFALVGVTGMVVDLACFCLLLLLLPVGSARAVSIWVAMTWNFGLNRRVTFSYARHQPLIRQYLLFCGSCLTGAVVNWSTSVTLCAGVEFFSDHPSLGAVAGVAAGFALNYFLSHRFVFRPKKTAIEDIGS